MKPLRPPASGSVGLVAGCTSGEPATSSTQYLTIRVLLEADVCEIREHELLCEYAADYLRRDLLISPSDHLTIVWKGGSTPDRRRMTKLMRGLIRAGFKNVGLVATEAHSRANSRGDV